MFHLIGFIIFGFVVGLLARLLAPGHPHMSLPKTIGLGVFGAIIAGWFGRFVGWYGPDDNAGFIASTVGAIVLLLAYHGIVKRRGKEVEMRSDSNSPTKAA